MSQSLGDSCLFYYRYDFKLEGMILVHVDDFLAAGSKIFEQSIMESLISKFSFGTVSNKDFIYTGISIKQNEEKIIFINQNQFSQSIPVHEYAKGEPDKELSETENSSIRKSVGQLNWLSSQTRPDLSYDAYFLSTCLNKATYSDAKYSTKVIQKSKKEKVQLKFAHLGFWKDLHIELYVDASLGNIDVNGMTKSMMGYFLVLCDKNGDFSPIHWKSKVIDKVTPDIKTAETIALEIALDDAIYMSKMISEIYTGNLDTFKIPFVINEDSKSLVQSLSSTKKVKRKTMRLVISSIQQSINDGTISDIFHVSTKDQLADTFTKKGVKNDKLLKCLASGNLST